MIRGRGTTRFAVVRRGRGSIGFAVVRRGQGSAGFAVVRRGLGTAGLAVVSRVRPVIGTAGRAAAAAVALLVSGCGASPAMQVRHDPVVKVGAIVSRTGVYARLGEDMETAMRLYLQAHDGLLGGRPARLVVADDAGSPDQGRQQARRLVSREGVSVITGLVSSPVAVEVVREVTGTPVVIANAGADELGGPAVFRVSSTNREQGEAAGRYAAQVHGRVRAVAMASDYSAGVQTLDGFAAGFGAEPVKRVLTPFGDATDLGPYLSRVPADAELLYAFYAGAEAVSFARTYKQLGYDRKVELLACQQLADEDVVAAVGADAEGMTSVGLYSPALTNPANTAFTARWRAATGRDPSTVAVQGWDAMRLIDLAVSEGGADSGDLARALGEVKQVDSPRGTFRLDPVTHNPVQNWYARRYENGVNRVIATIPPRG
ncbi:ABC transporter substrate-binding protein [Nonomuraea roseoviolacea subsp. roseoviolacea]|uniref:ABC transporter substrate-binding protein n=1 Tax=Nonomuraea roseoviolacea TaxID=103837 RepID=UPI0031D3E940